MAQRRPTPRASPRGKVAAKKAPAAKKATALVKKVPAVAKKVLAAAKKAVPGTKRAATRAPAAKTPAKKAPAAKRAVRAEQEALGPKSASPRGEKLAQAVSAAAGTAPRKGARGMKPPASPDTQEAKPSPMPPAAPRGEKLAEAVQAAASPDSESAPAEPARPAGPPAETQYLVLTGGSPFLRAIGYVQRAGGEPLPDFGNLTVAKMASPALPTEPGTYEFRFRVRNGTGDFKLAQRNEKGATKNSHSYEVDPKDAPQTWRFTIP